MKTLESIGEVARELSLRYSLALKNKSEFKKGEKREIYLGIISELFSSHGVALGYCDIHSFRSDLIHCKNQKKEVDVVSITFESGNIFLGRLPSEGSNNFTSWQIKEYGLDPDSY